MSDRNARFRNNNENENGEKAQKKSLNAEFYLLGIQFFFLLLFGRLSLLLSRIWFWCVWAMPKTAKLWVVACDVPVVPLRLTYGVFDTEWTVPSINWMYVIMMQSIWCQLIVICHKNGLIDKCPDRWNWIWIIDMCWLVATHCGCFCLLFLLASGASILFMIHSLLVLVCSVNVTLHCCWSFQGLIYSESNQRCFISF